MSFDDFLAKREAERATAPPRVTWRRVSALTGGGWSGLGPNGALLFIRKNSLLGGAFVYGRVVGKERQAEGFAQSLSDAKRLAAGLLRRES